MKIDVNDKGTIVLTDVYECVRFETEGGNVLAVCMRDDTYEIFSGIRHGYGGWYRRELHGGGFLPFARKEGFIKSEALHPMAGQVAEAGPGRVAGVPPPEPAGAPVCRNCGGWSIGDDGQCMGCGALMGMKQEQRFTPSGVLSCEDCGGTDCSHVSFEKCYDCGGKMTNRNKEVSIMATDAQTRGEAAEKPDAVEGGQVEGEIMCLEGLSMSALARAVAELEERLSAVLSEVPEEEQPKREVLCMVPLALRVQQARIALEDETKKLRQILRRIQL
jgi:hypothetical protein